MDKSVKEIIALYKDCSELIDKKADWTWSDNPLTWVGKKFNPISNVARFFAETGKWLVIGIEKLLGKDSNLLKSASTLIDYLKKSKLEGASSWNSIVDNSIKNISNSFSKIQIKKYNTKAETEEQIKANIGILFSAQNALPKIIKEVENLMSPDIKKIYETEAKTQFEKLFNTVSFSEMSVYGDIVRYCEIIKVQATEYKENITNLLMQAKDLYFEAKKQQKSITDEQKQTEEFLADKEKEDKQLEQFLGQK